MSEPRSSLVNIEMRRATRYLTGEASISGYRIGRAARDSSGVPGATCRERTDVNWGGPFMPLLKYRGEETAGIRCNLKSGRVWKGFGWGNSTVGI